MHHQTRESLVHAVDTSRLECKSTPHAPLWNENLIWHVPSLRGSCLCNEIRTVPVEGSMTLNFFFVFFASVTGPRRSLGLKLSDTRVYEPQIQDSALKHDPGQMVQARSLLKQAKRLRSLSSLFFCLLQESEERERSKPSERAKQALSLRSLACEAKRRVWCTPAGLSVNVYYSVVYKMEGCCEASYKTGGCCVRWGNVVGRKGSDARG